MRTLLPDPAGPELKNRRHERAGARIMALAAACFALGLGGGAYLYYRLAAPPAPRAPSVRPPEPERSLSGGTKGVLKRLDGPVAIRYYSLLDPTATPVGMNQYAERVSQLLAAYQAEAGGKIKVSRINTRSDAAEASASADGIQAFNLDKGDACYLGLAIERGDRREALQLSPDWEGGLESDLSRALARVASPKPAAAPPPQPDRAAFEEVKRFIPNVAAVSLEEGTKILRTKALMEFGAITQDLETQIKQAEQRFAQAQNDAERQAARDELLRIRTEQMEKLKTVAMQLQAQIGALEQMKQK